MRQLCKKIFAFVQIVEQTCIGPDGKAGNCILLRSCDSLFTLIKKKPLLAEDRVYLSQSQCGWSREENHPLVCCSDPLETPVRVGESLLPPVGVCGVQTSDRIVGGVNTKIDEFPWLALLKYAKRKSLIIGGTIEFDFLITVSFSSMCVRWRKCSKQRIRIPLWRSAHQQSLRIDGVALCQWQGYSNDLESVSIKDNSG